MVPYYAKHTFEIIMSKKRIAQLLGAIDSVTSQYIPIMSSIIQSVPQCSSGLPSKEVELKNWWGSPYKDSLMLEIFVPRSSEDSLYFLQLRHVRHLGTDWGRRYRGRDVGYLVVSGFSQHVDTSSEVVRFHDMLADSIKSHFELRRVPDPVPIRKIHETYKKLSKGTHLTPAIRSEMLPVLESMLESTFRNSIIRAKQAKDPTLKNIAKSTGLDPDVVVPIIEEAMGHDLLERHHNVICPSCGNTLARVRTRSAITQMVRDKVTCPSCKAVVTETSCADCYLATERASELLDGSNWMSILVRHRLAAHFPEAWAITSVRDGPNELDLVANLDGPLLLMELKDNRFSIGHAYSFVGKCSQYRPDLSMIVATEGIDEEVVEYVGNTRIETEFVHSLEDLPAKLTDVCSRVNEKRLTQLLTEVSWDTMISQALLSSFGLESPLPQEIHASRGFRFSEIRKFISE